LPLVQRLIVLVTACLPGAVMACMGLLFLCLPLWCVTADYELDH
jgi:hypothetical protein